MAMPRTATSSEEDEGAEERGPGIGGREGEKGTTWASRTECRAMTGVASVGPAHAGREGEGEEWSGLLWAERVEGEK